MISQKDTPDTEIGVSTLYFYFGDVDAGKSVTREVYVPCAALIILDVSLHAASVAGAATYAYSVSVGAANSAPESSSGESVREATGLSVLRHRWVPTVRTQIPCSAGEGAIPPGIALRLNVTATGDNVGSVTGLIRCKILNGLEV